MYFEYPFQAHALSGLNHTGVYGVVALSPGDGATTTTAALAHFLSNQLMQQVLVVDGNLYNPGLHGVLGLPQQQGLADLFRDTELGLGDVVVSVNPKIEMIPAGPEGSSGVFLSKLRRMESLLEQMRSSYPYVLWDLGAPSHSHGLTGIAHLFDGIIIVVCCRNSRWEVAQELKDELLKANAKILGTVMNRREFYIPDWLYRFV